MSTELQIPPCLSRCLRLDCFQLLLDYSRSLQKNGSTSEQANYKCAALLHQFEHRWSETAKLLRKCRAAQECNATKSRSALKTTLPDVDSALFNFENGRRDRIPTKLKKGSPRSSKQRTPTSPHSAKNTHIEGLHHSADSFDSETIPDITTLSPKQATPDQQHPSRSSRSPKPPKTASTPCRSEPVGNTPAPFFSLSEHTPCELPSRPVTTRPPYRCATIQDGLETFCLHQEQRVIGIAWGSGHVPRLAVALEDGRVIIWRAGDGGNGMTEWTIQRVIDAKTRLPTSPTSIVLSFTSDDLRILISPRYANRNYPSTTVVQERLNDISETMCIHIHGIIEPCDESAIRQNQDELLRRPCTASETCGCVMRGFPVAIVKDGTCIVSGTCGRGEIAIFMLTETGLVETPHVLPIVQKASCPMQSLAVVSNNKNVVAGLCGSYFALWDIANETLLSATELNCPSPEKLVCFSVTVPNKFSLALKNCQPDSTCVLIYVSGLKSNFECSAVLVYGTQSVECVTYLESSNLTSVAVAGDYLIGARESGGLAVWDKRASDGPCFFGTEAYEYIGVSENGAYATASTRACVHFFGSRDTNL